MLVDAYGGTVRLELVAAGADSGRGRHIVLTLTWEPAEPLEVAVAVTAQPDHPALPRGNWLILRDFLRYGLAAPTGDGAVRLRPDPTAAIGPCVWLELARTGRPCCIAVPEELLAAFLDETEKTVPLGEERSEALVDEVIARLLRA